MNTVITSKAAIMHACRGIVAKKGLKALNMRLVAEECQIALGTLYNYYADKDALVLAAVESIWCEIFHANAQQTADTSFRHLWLTVVLSFACYIPVVLFADAIPAVGMLMIPKTCAYVWTVLIGYIAMKKEIVK